MQADSESYELAAFPTHASIVVEVFAELPPTIVTMMSDRIACAHTAVEKCKQRLRFTTPRQDN